MVMQKAKDIVLKVGDGSDPEVFNTIGAARATSFTVNNNVVDITSLNSNGFKELQANGAVQSISIQLDGIFKDSSAEEEVRTAAFNGSLKNYQFQFANGDYIESSFAVVSYLRQGSYNGLELFTLRLESSGQYSFTKGA